MFAYMLIITLNGTLTAGPFAQVNEALTEENTEVGRLYEKKMRRSDPDEKQTLFRQQVPIG